MEGVRVRGATGEDVPLILYLIRELAEYEKLSQRGHESKGGVAARVRPHAVLLAEISFAFSPSANELTVTPAITLPSSPVLRSLVGAEDHHREYVCLGWGEYPRLPGPAIRREAIQNLGVGIYACRSSREHVVSLIA